MPKKPKYNAESMRQAIVNLSRVEEIVNGKNSTHFQFVYSIHIAEHFAILPTSVRRAIRRLGLEPFLQEVKKSKLAEFEKNLSGQQCRTCKTHKPFSEFHKYDRIKSGYRLECKSCRKNNYELNSEEICKKRKVYYNLNKTKIRKRQQIWTSNNLDKILAYQKHKKETDPLFALQCRIRGCIHSAFRRNSLSKNTKTAKILGTDWNGLKQHFESLFLKGMSWDNMHLWVIDHVVPVSTATTEEEIIKLNHYTNLQPLWAEVNIWKSDSLDYDLQNGLAYWYEAYAKQYKISA